MISAKGMHSLAVAAAIERGPQTISVNGRLRAVYSLGFNELRRLFAEQGYNTDRITWRKIILSWGDTELWGEITPSEKILLDKTSVGWSVIFITMAASDLFRLRKYAETNNVQALPWEEEQTRDQGLIVCQSPA